MGSHAPSGPSRLGVRLGAHRWHVRFSASGAIGALLLAMTTGFIVTATSSSAIVNSIPANYFTVHDQDGANDVPAQNDVTQMGRDDAAGNPAGTVLSVFWSWDSTDQWAGQGQTGNACALFDTDGDGDINFAVCGEIHNPNGSTATVTQTLDSPKVFTCSDAKNDRCTNPVPVSFTSAQLKSGTIDTLAAGDDLITATDPFPAVGSNTPNDATLRVDMLKTWLDSVLHAPATMVNVCSYPSNGNGANNNPFDCIVNPGGGFLVVTKDASPVDGTFNFSTPGGTKSVTTVGGTGSTTPIPLTIASAAASTYAVSETIPSTWDLTGASCKIEGTGPDVGSFTSPTVSAIPILSGQRTICVFTDVKQQPSIGVVKSVSVDGGTTWLDANTAAGAPTLLSGNNPQYKFVVSNTGNVPLTNVTLSDTPALTLTGCVLPTSLAVGGSVTCYATGTWAAGAQTDTANASGTFGGTPYTASDPAHYFGATATIDVKKEVSVDGGSTWADANSPTGPFLTSGTDPQFRFTLKNTGNVTLSSVSLTDSDFSLAGCSPAVPTSLAPNATYTCTLTEPWAAGQHTDTATGTGSYTDSGGHTATPSDTDDANYFGGTPTLEVTKYVSVDGGTTWLDANTGPGPSLLSGHDPQFKFVVHNAGNVTLSNVSISDSDFSLAGCNPALPSSLAANATYTCILTEPWAAGLHADTLSASGTFGGTTYPASDEAHYEGITATVSVTKEVSVDGGTTWQDANTVPGPTLLDGTDPQFRLTLQNTGTADLTAVSLTDSDFSLAGCSPAVPATLTAGAQFTCVLTEPWAAGQHTDTATGGGSATDSGGHTATPSGNDDANYFGARPAVSVVKYVSADNGATWVDADTAPGPQVPQGTDPTYKFVVTNSGNVAMPVDLSDAPALTFTGAGCTLPKTLAPGASVECFATGTWAIGQQHDLATATGSYTDSAGHSAAPNGTNAANYFGAAPALSLTKSASPTTYSGSGVSITYTYVVTNTGNTTLTTAITVTDDKTTVTCPALPAGGLAPAASITCTATYVTQAADVNAGKVTNHATAHSGGVSSNQATATVNYVPPSVPAIGLAKTATPTTYKTVGETISYSYVITNVGNVALSGPFTVADNKATVTCPATPTLAIGAAITCTASYTIKQADIDAGSVTNIATASGGGVTSSPASATVNAVLDPRWTLTKSSNPPSGSVVQPGQRIDYTVTYTNTGNVTLADVAVTDHVPAGTTYVVGSAAPAGASFDPATDIVTWHTGAVAPGAAMTFTFSVTVDAGLAAGTDIVNVAMVGTLPSNETRNPVGTGSLGVSKTVDKASAEYGDTLTYTVTATAKGTLNQTGVVVTDVVPDGTTYVAGSATCASPCTAAYDAATRTVTWRVGNLAAGSSVTGLVFKVTIDQVTANPDGSIPSRVITNVAEVRSDQVTTTPSEPVQTIVTAVLGEQIVRPPALPFTGSPIQQLVAVAAMLLAGGILLATRRRRSD